jgi:hypothetical protein
MLRTNFKLAPLTIANRTPSPSVLTSVFEGGLDEEKEEEEEEEEGLGMAKETSSENRFCVSKMSVRCVTVV